MPHWINPDVPHLPIEVEPGITLDELVTRIQAARGRPLRIEELAELAENDSALCGLWLATDDADIILHAPSESVLHREQFILHELAHMLLMHDRVDRTGGYVTASVLPGFENTTIIKALGRDRISDQYELAAERLADVLATHIRRRPESKFSEIFG
jgi:hypothetical protein